MFLLCNVRYNPKYHYSKPLYIFHYKFHFFFIYLSILAIFSEIHKTNIVRNIHSHLF